MKKIWKVLLLGAVAALVFVLAGCGQQNASNGGGGDATAPADTATANAGAIGDPELAGKSWDEIVKAADGQTVSFLAWGSLGADPYVQKMWEDLAARVKDKYNVTIQYTDWDQAEYQKLTTDIENGAPATYDLFWYNGATIAPLRAINGVLTNWVSVLDNSKYLDMSNEFNQFDGVQGTDNLEAPFQSVQPSLVYSADKWDHHLAWNEEKNGVKGLFHNFAELQEWAKANPGQFTYMDLTGAGSFHGTLFLEAILAELTDDGNGGWKPVYDESDDAATRHQKIQANIDQWYEWSNSPEASEEAFYKKAGYVWAYLNELAPNLMQGDNGPMYIATAPEMRQYVIAGDLACVFTTCTSVSSRVADAPSDYPSNPAIYMLQTSIGSWDYSVIMNNSQHKAAALVVANEMLDPDFQANAFLTDGNGYSVDYNKLGSEQKATFDKVFKEMGTLTPTADELAVQSYNDKLGNVTAWLASGWDQYVNKASGASAQ
jgi:ABC-type uncharacterized transport system YnjBCD substrate-binding protein